MTADGAAAHRQRLHAIPTCSGRLKGGGGGSFGVVTRLTLRVHPLPETFGAVNLTVKAASDAAFRRLIAPHPRLLRRGAVEPALGRADPLSAATTRCSVSMVFQGLTAARRRRRGSRSSMRSIAAAKDFDLEFSPLRIVSTSARDVLVADARQARARLHQARRPPGAPESNVFWPGDQGQAGQALHGYESVWLPAALLPTSAAPGSATRCSRRARHWRVSLHLNKGLAGAPAEVIAAARDTATHPAVLDAFALAILGVRKAPPPIPASPATSPTWRAGASAAQPRSRAPWPS